MDLTNGNVHALQNVDANALGSDYASTYTHNETNLIRRITAEEIYDAAPKQFLDLKLWNMCEHESIISDEVYYQEMGYQRKAIVATSAAAAAAAGSTHTFNVAEASSVATDMIVGYQDNSRGTITNVSGNTITVTPEVSGTLPAVAADDELFFIAPVEADGTETIAMYFRADTIERYNFLQLFSIGKLYGEVEWKKYTLAGTTKNFLSLEKSAMLRQFRISISNAFWNGNVGEVITASGQKAKTMGGVIPFMLAAGVVEVSATLATMQDAFEDAAADSEYGDYGDVRMVFAVPKLLRKLSKLYKDEKTRYEPNDMVAKLMLEEVNIGSSRLVFVPFARLGDTASFPADFKRKIIILDMENIKKCSMIGERSEDPEDSRELGGRKRQKEMFYDADYTMKFLNPLGCALLDITDFA